MHKTLVLFSVHALLVGAFIFGQPPLPNAKEIAGPKGTVPRMPDGKPDLSGVWERPFVMDMTKSAPNQQGTPELPLTAWGLANLQEEFDYSAHCLPLGYTRSINSPMPMEIEIGRAHV
jgi:hypothetical protein